MKVKTIYPCVCIDHKPDHIASGTDGMPTLQVYSGGDSYSFIACCPHCGRGDLNSFPTQYQALKEWNETQKTCWDWLCRDFWSGELKADVEPWRAEILEMMAEDAKGGQK